MSLLWKLLIAEYCVALFLLATAYFARPASLATRKRARRRRDGVSLLLVFAVALMLAAACSYLRSPTPKVHDEFSYLLAADTFASGRLANPRHALWRHFESIHILASPTYASKYPPMQGLFLALGQALTGHAIVGVWLSTAAAAAASTWMLQAWFSSRWSRIGVAIVLLYPTLQILWGVTFMGGAVSMLGAALLFGAWGRITRGNVSPSVVAIGAIGLMVLANSRPFEGLLVAAPIAAVMVVGLLRRSAPIVRLVTPANVGVFAAVVAISTAGMMTYNKAVTGDWFEMPYKRHTQDYMAGVLFVGQALPEQPEYGNRQLRDFHASWEVQCLMTLKRPWAEFLWAKVEAMSHSLHFATRPTLILLAIIGAGWRLNRLSTPGASLALGLLGFLATVWVLPHYFGPLVPPLLLLAINGLRRNSVLTGLRGGWGQVASFRLAACYFAFLLIPFASFLLDADRGWHRERARIQAELESLPGEHLVIVSYSPNRKTYDEWVYNRANIDAAKVVWARDLEGNRNAKLIEYYNDRSLWILDADANPPRLRAYSRQLAKEGEDSRQ